MKTCPVPLCGAPRIKAGMLMCAACWRSVPRKLQAAVRAAWRQLDGRHGDRCEGQGSSRLARVRAYQVAREAAIGASAAAR